MSLGSIETVHKSAKLDKQARLASIMVGCYELYAVCDWYQYQIYIRLEEKIGPSSKVAERIGETLRVHLTRRSRSQRTF